VAILWQSTEYFFDAFDMLEQGLCHTRFLPGKGGGFEL